MNMCLTILVYNDIWNAWVFLDLDTNTENTVNGVITMIFLEKIGWIGIIPAAIKLKRERTMKELNEMYPGTVNVY